MTTTTTTTTTTPVLVTGWDALPVIRECDRLMHAGRVAERNALLLTVDPTMRNGREVI